MASSKSKLNLLAVLFIAVVVVGGIGSYFVFYPQTGPTTRTTSATSSLQTTSKPLVTYSIFGKIFFDYNGNGKQDPGEPDMPDVIIALNGKNVTATNSTGWYAITSVANGNHTIRPYPPRDFTYTYGYSTRLADFRYMCESDAEYRSVKDSYTLQVGNDTRKDIGLMEGFLTMPFSRGTVEYARRLYVDISNSSRLIDWQGSSQTYQRDSYKHQGIDYLIVKMTPIMAAAPGDITGYEINNKEGHTLWIGHNEGYYTVYAHLYVIVKSKGPVKRGELVGFSGYSSNGDEHLHFELEKPPVPQNKPYVHPVDPYRSLIPPLGSPLSLWTKDNDPQFYA